MDMAGLEAGAVHRSDSWARHCARLSVFKGRNRSQLSDLSPPGFDHLHLIFEDSAPASVPLGSQESTEDSALKLQSRDLSAPWPAHCSWLPGNVPSSLHLHTQLVTGVWENNYNFFCQGTRSAGEADMKIVEVLWWYYFSKLIEFMDTFFFILRKNNHQITVLHVYHHATMLNIWWFVMNWVPCGHSYFGATLNSFIHVLMYSYYGLSSIPSMRPYLWWKKYITQGQLLQFVLTIIQTSCGVIWSCTFPLGWLYFQIGYMISLIALFTNFYIQTYNKKSASRRKERLREHQNGSVAAVNGHTTSFSSLENNVKLRKQRKD
ncbi:very long chain fatty acid elongase 5 isoform X2 [Equus przewalskii]|uniref:Elongation of very long chain fatty acids protein n=1 Tax=Equus przewalskii TaxID=9798 RepID=A0ABM4LPF7_EQUPR